MIALYVHPKNSNHLRSHLRAIMALVHRLGWKTNSWKTNQAEFFAFDKFTYKQNLANKSGCNFSRQFFTIFQDKYSEPSKHTWAFSKTVQKISKNSYTASRFSLLTSAKFSVNIKRVMLQHNKEFIAFIFFI